MAAMLAGGACSAAEPERVRIAGSDLLGPAFAAALGRCAAPDGPPPAIALAGTRPALAGLRAGVVDLGFLLLPADESPPVNAGCRRIIAFQAVVFVVTESSPLRDMTLTQARRLLAPPGPRGAATWGDIGFGGEWRDRPVDLHALASEAGLAAPLIRRVLFGDGEPAAAVRPAADAALLEARLRAGGDAAIGLTVGVPDEGSGLRAVALAAGPREPAFPPTAQALASGHYPLRLALWLVVRRETLPRVMPLLRGLLLGEGTAALAAARFEPLPRAAREELLVTLEAAR